MCGSMDSHLSSEAVVHLYGADLFLGDLYTGSILRSLASKHVFEE